MNFCKYFFTACTCTLIMAFPVFAEFVPGEYAPDEHTISLWHLDENSGINVNDLMGVNNGFFIDGGWGNIFAPQWTAGIFGRGVHLSGGLNDDINSFGAIELPGGMLNAFQDWTLEMYLKWDYRSVGPDTRDPGFLGYLFADGHNTFVRAYIDDSDPARNKCKLSFGVQSYAGVKEVSTPPSFCLDADVWTHVAFVVYSRTNEPPSPSNLVISIYVNGQLAIRSNWPTGAFQTGTFTQLGMTNYGVASWGGVVDEIRFSDIARDKFGLPSCGDWNYRTSDFDQNCQVDFKDVSILTQNWLLNY